MSNVLSDEKKNQILALGGLGWSLRRIEEQTGVRRETAAAYMRAAGIAVRGRGGLVSDWSPKPAIAEGVSTDSGPKPAISGGVSTDSKPATTEGVSTDPDSKPAISAEGVSTDSGTPEKANSELRVPGQAPNGSACEPFRELIEEALSRGRNAMAIYQDLVDDHGFKARYSSVKRFVKSLRGGAPVEARVIIATAPGEEAQVDMQCARGNICTGRFESGEFLRSASDYWNPSGTPGDFRSSAPLRRDITFSLYILAEMRW